VSLLPSVEQELMRVARAPVGRSEPPARAPWRPRLSGAMIAVAVSVVALMIGAGFLVALRGAGRGTIAQRPPAPAPGHGAFPGAPRASYGRFTRQGRYICPQQAHNRYLPRSAGCVTSVLRADMTGGGSKDLVILYADLGFRRKAGGYGVAGFTLEVVRPGGAITRRSVQADPFPWISRVGNINGVPGAELVLHTEDVSSGDGYRVYTDRAERLRDVSPLPLFAGGDSADKEGFACTTSPQRRFVVRVMSLLGPTIHGRWRWTVLTFRWELGGATLHRLSRRTFVRHGQPPRRDTAAGAGCGRPSGATQSHPG
jgi:hypothetical protein